MLQLTAKFTLSAELRSDTKASSLAKLATASWRLADCCGMDLRGGGAEWEVNMRSRLSLLAHANTVEIYERKALEQVFH